MKQNNNQALGSVIKPNKAFSRETFTSNNDNECKSLDISIRTALLMLWFQQKSSRYP